MYTQKYGFKSKKLVKVEKFKFKNQSENVRNTKQLAE